MPVLLGAAHRPRRAEGRAALPSGLFPMRSRVNAAGRCVCRRPARLRSYRSSPTRGAFETEWGSYGGGPRPVRPDRAVPGKRNLRGQRVRPRLRLTTGIRESFSTPNGDVSSRSRWGHKGSELGPVSASAHRRTYTQAGPGWRGDRGRRQLRLRRRLRQQSHRSASKRGKAAKAMEWGFAGERPPASSPTRAVVAARTRGEVLVADDDNHRIEKIRPSTAAYQKLGGIAGEQAPAQFGLPVRPSRWTPPGNAYVADDLNHRVVKADAGNWRSPARGAANGTKPGASWPSHAPSRANPAGGHICREHGQRIGSRCTTRKDAFLRTPRAPPARGPRWR